MKKKSIFLILITISLILIITTLNASNQTNQIPLKTKFDIKTNFETFSKNPNEPSHYIIQFTQPIKQEWKTELQNQNIQIISYLPDFAFITLATPNQIKQIQNLPNINQIIPYLPEYKTDKKLLQTQEDEINITITLFNEEPKQDTEKKIKSLNGKIQKKSKNKIIAKIKKENLNQLSQTQNILWIEKYEPPKILNNIAKNITQTSQTSNNLGLYGNNQIIAIADTGLDIGVNNQSLHPDFLGRITQIVDLWGDGANDDNGHGTHVAGSAAGNGNLSGSDPQNHNYTNSFAGTAPESSIYFQAMEYTGSLYIPADLSDLFTPAYNIGARIHSDSWGSDCYGDYTSGSQDVDQFIWNSPEMTILFAAGNSGTDSNSDGKIDNDSITCPATSKNAITVGASENYRPSQTATWGSTWPSDYPANPVKDDKLADNISGLAAFSSRGPTNDGRIKPDIVAPGTYIISTLSQDPSATTGWGAYNSYYNYNGGTSMSTPLVAGIVALIREHLNTTLNISNPSSALIKAILINGAYDMTPGQYGTNPTTQEITRKPDTNQGWGRVDTQNSITTNTTKKIKHTDNIAGLQTGETYTHSFYSDSNLPIKITLVWSDYPATVSASTTLVNDLDLTLTTPNNTIYNGNDYSAPFSDTTDRKNNVETIDILTPQQGLYTINITAYNIPNGPQPFALVITHENLPLKINLTSPQNTTYQNSNITINFTLNQISSAKYSLNNAQNKSLTTTDNLTFTNYIANLTNGNYNLKIYANDTQNQTNSTQISFTINDTTPPQITFTSQTPQTGTITSEKNITIKINISDPALKNATLNFNSTSYLLNCTTSQTTSLCEINLTSLNDSTYYYNATATDINGNQNTTQTRTITIDTNLPQINSTIPQNNTQINTTKLSFNLQANFSKNITNITYQIDSVIFDITENINGNHLNSTIEIPKYGTSIILLNFTAINNKTNTYKLTINASLFLNGTQNDTDGDGINNSLDKVLGTSLNINTNIQNIIIKINDSDNITKIFTNEQNITFYNGSKKLVETKNNFSANPIDLTNTTIKTAIQNTLSKILIRGFKPDENNKKTIYLELSGNKTKNSAICIKDAQILDFAQISQSCTGTNETYLNSIPQTSGNYFANYTNSSNTTIKITGLTHSAISQMCKENWVYSGWGTCSGTTQTRTATDLNNCSTTLTRATLSQTCDGGGGNGGGGGGSTTAPKINKLIYPEKPNKKLDLTIDGEKTTLTTFAGNKKIELKEKSLNKTIIAFIHNFTNSELNLQKLEIEYNFSHQNSYMIINGAENINKNITIPANKNSNLVCIKDSKIESIHEFTTNCNSPDEILINCSKGGTIKYPCQKQKGYYTISGLTNSGVMEYEYLGEIIPEKTNITKIETVQKEIEIKENETITELPQKAIDSKTILIIAGITTIILIVIIFAIKKRCKKASL